jgi:hypothetical protein
MKRYYFDIREGDEIIPDEEGIDLPNLAKVQEEAARALVDAVRDASHRSSQGGAQYVAVEVRDKDGAVLQAQFSFRAGNIKP